MAYLILFVVLGFLIGSWLMIRPSPYQKRLAGLRRYAMSVGIKVQMGGLKRAGEKTIPQGQVLYLIYWSKLEVMPCEEHEFTLKSRFSSDFPELDQRIDRFLQNWSSCIDSVQLQTSGLGFIWSESLGLEEAKPMLDEFVLLQNDVEQRLLLA